MELDELKKLNPRERLQRLKELEDKKKEEIKEAEVMISQAERDIQKEEIVKNIEVPHEDTPKIRELLEEETDSVLENTINTSDIPDDVSGFQYQIPAQLQNEISDLYTRMNELRHNSNWSEEEFGSFYEATERINEIHNKFEEKVRQGYTISEDVTSRLVASQNVEYNIKKYREFGK